MLSRNIVENVIAIYKQAWQSQDSRLILSIFSADASYHERVFAKPYRGHAEIKQYWEDKVVATQANIVFTLLNLYIDGDTAIAEWEARFDDRARRVKKRMREVAILEFRGDLIYSLREYWQSIEE